MNIPSFIEELVEEGIPVTLQKGGSFHIEGFYKSSGVTVQLEDDGWVAVARYNEVTQIETLHDLVGLNYHWWQCSKDRFDGWSQPESAWVPLLLKFGYIKEKTIPAQTVYE
jgi:hypothetical protein